MLLTLVFGVLGICIGATRGLDGRALLLPAALLIFLRTHAYDPLLFFALQSGIVILGVKLWRWRFGADESRVGQSLNFSLRILLVATALISLVLAVGVRTRLPSVSVWMNLVSGAVACGVATLLGAWGLVTPWRWRRLLVAVPALLIATLPMCFTDSLLFHFPYYEWQHSSGSTQLPTFRYFCVWSVTLSLLSMLTFLVCWTHVLTVEWPRSAWKRVRNGFVALLIAAVGVMIVAVPGMPPTFEPDTDVDDSFVLHVVDEVGISPEPDHDGALVDLPDDKLRQYVHSNSKALEVIYKGLTRPVRLRENPGPFTRWRPLSGSLKKVNDIHTLLFHQLELFEREERYDEGAELSLEMLAFGHSVAKDDALFNALVGRRFHYSALRFLTRCRGRFNNDQRHLVLSGIESSDAMYEPYDDALSRNRKIWSRRLGWTNVLHQAFPKSTEDIEQMRISKLGWYRYQTVGRLLAADMRIRQHRESHGSSPETLEIVADGTNNEMLTDPYGDGAQLGYEINELDYVLYSRGMDLVDDGGIPGALNNSWNDNFAKGDWTLDAFFEPLDSERD